MWTFRFLDRKVEFMWFIVFFKLLTSCMSLCFKSFNSMTSFDMCCKGFTSLTHVSTCVWTASLPWQVSLNMCFNCFNPWHSAVYVFQLFHFHDNVSHPWHHTVYVFELFHILDTFQYMCFNCFTSLVLQSDLLISQFEVTWACKRSLGHSKEVTLKKLVHDKFQ